jgi:hypothetical protein
MQRPDRTEIQSVTLLFLLSLHCVMSTNSRAVYNDIFYTGPYLSLAKLKEAAFQARLLRVRPNDLERGELVPGRSVAWKVS